MWGRLAPHQPLPRGHHVRHRRRRPAGRRRRPRASTSGCTGTMPDGTPYAASDPHLLRVGARRRGRQLPARPPGLRPPAARPGRPRRVRRPDRRGRRAGSGVARPADAPRPSWPPCWRRTAPSCAAPPQAREAIRYLLLRPPLPLAARPPYGVLVAAAIGLMPALDPAAAAAALAAGRPSAPSCGRSAAPPPGRSGGRSSRRRQDTDMSASDQ